MSTYDLLVRNGTLASGETIDLAVSAGTIVALGRELTGSAQEEIDASGLYLFPGGIDAHVHINEPGRTHWEGFATGSRALAAGGMTAFFDMPLNSTPPTRDAAAFRQKLEAAQQASLLDFAFWGALQPDNLEQLDELVECGVIGFKAFMSESGTDDFQSVDDLTLYEGMQRIAKLGSLLAVHAENLTLTRALAQRARAQGKTDIRAYLESRPIIAEVEAIQRAILFADETGCPLHIVHVSCGAGVRLVIEARARGVDVSCETCPHYLVLTEEDVEQLGAVAKCAPPLRPLEEQEALWDYVRRGEIAFVASDHSPAPRELKEHEDFFAAWGGISGAQSTLPLLLTEGYAARRLPLPLLVELISARVARRFRLWPQKGSLTVGSDADFVLVRLEKRYTLQQDGLFYRHQHSPYIGREMQGVIERTVVRGQTVYLEGWHAERPYGRLLRPGAKV
ncbi:allantoinase [Thermosporothrix hazakensis]|jgi:allantoinase|uniref:Allantoinase n=2 Tax=Thermosporothrix TaxID=768650 RepID=A0A326U794_THEHA|nr:allantoinase [Thermosporothrix hazakensis]PZW29328.1 allantoinase [Thermosporothrix hazakensis]BBH86257.1 allantoinase [Thermosporothrix sp. COM3]GCE45321.1 allantoinase [Thermosporothrix hazakensis]